MIKLLIFDLDGTLADTSQDITDAINYALDPFGMRKYSVEETKAMVGSGISKLLESLIPVDAVIPPGRHQKKDDNNNCSGKLEITNPKELVTNRFLEFYSGHLLDNTKAYPHVKDTLSILGGYKKAVLSNKREEYSTRILEGLGLSEYFDIVCGSDSVREKKPSPIPVLDLLEKFNVAKDDAVVIGDSNYDVEAAMAAGVKVIGVTYGFRSMDFLKGSDFIIDSFGELLNIIPKLNRTN